MVDQIIKILLMFVSCVRDSMAVAVKGLLIRSVRKFVVSTPLAVAVSVYSPVEMIVLNKGSPVRKQESLFIYITFKNCT